MTNLPKILFFALVVKPVMGIVLGLNVKHRERLPLQGPAILAANHNSHLDTNVLLSLFPLSVLPRVRPVAAADYFYSTAFLKWFATRCFGIIPILRGGDRNEVQRLCEEALDRGEILVLFPEGSRGEPEEIAPFKKGVAYIARSRPQAKVFPVFLHGLGKTLPKGGRIPVPFFCDVVIGEPMPANDDPAAFTQALESAVRGLSKESNAVGWEDDA